MLGSFKLGLPGAHRDTSSLESGPDVHGPALSLILDKPSRKSLLTSRVQGQGFINCLGFRIGRRTRHHHPTTHQALFVGKAVLPNNQWCLGVQGRHINKRDGETCAGQDQQSQRAPSLDEADLATASRGHPSSCCPSPAGTAGDEP